MNYSFLNQLALFTVAALPLVVQADSTIDATNKYAWEANTGWTDFAPSESDGVVVQGAYLSGFAWSPNTGWIHFGDGQPDNGYAYSNTGSDFGVNHDGAGGLSGYAWSANTGWINFGWASSGSPDQPRINLETGALEGYAWGANTGWLRLGTGRLETDAIRRPDQDGDSVRDSFEFFHFGDLTTAAAQTDQDGDGRSDAEEALAGTDPLDSTSLLEMVAFDPNQDLDSATLEFTSQPGRVYTIQLANELDATTNWTNAAPTAFPPDGGATTQRSVSFNTSGDQKFFRILVERPLTP